MTINTEQWLHPVQRLYGCPLRPRPAVCETLFLRQRFAAGGVDTFSSCRRASAAAEPPKLQPVGSTPNAGAIGS